MALKDSAKKIAKNTYKTAKKANETRKTIKKGANKVKNVKNDIDQFANDSTQFAQDKLKQHTTDKLKKKASKKAKKLGKQAAKKVYTAVLKPILTFLISNPIGWLITAILIGLLLSIGTNVIDGAVSGGQTPVSPEILQQWQEHGIEIDYVTEDGIVMDTSGNIIAMNNGDVTIAQIIATTQDDCPPVNTSTIQTASDADIERNAQSFYSAMSVYGLSDEQIAGAWGNFIAESNANAKRLETDLTGDPSSGGALKKDAYELAEKYGPRIEKIGVNGWAGFVKAYGGTSLLEAGYLVDGEHWIGVGLGQWTGPGAKALWEYAQSNNVSMFDFETQLTFMLTDTPGSFFERLEYYKEVSAGKSAMGASDDFLRHWEINLAGLAHTKRLEEAAKWLIKFKNMKVDESYGESILSKAKQQRAQTNKRSKSEVDCDTKNKGGSIATGHMFGEDYDIIQPWRNYTFGGPHFGIDLVSTAGEGAPTYSVSDGTVVLADCTSDVMGPRNGYPSACMVTIKNADGSGYLSYGHFVTGSIKVNVGDEVKTGDYLADMGNTGITSIPHVHFQLDKVWGGGLTYENTPNPWQFVKGIDDPDQIDSAKNSSFPIRITVD